MPNAGMHNAQGRKLEYNFYDFSKVVIVLVYENVCWIRYWWSKPLSNVHKRTNYPGRLYKDSVAIALSSE